MTWYNTGFDDAMQHCVHECLKEQLINEIVIERGHPLKNYDAIYGGHPGYTHKQNPRVTTEWAFDLGGMVFTDEPKMNVLMHGLDVEVRNGFIPAVIERLEKLSLRRFSDGSEYYKAKFWLHATVMTPEQWYAIIRVLKAAEPQATAEYVAFMATKKKLPVYQVTSTGPKSDT